MSYAPPRTLLRTPALRSAEPLRLAVLADLHLSERARGTAKQLHRAEARFERAFDALRASRPDAIYVLGDVYHAAGGQPVERFERARRGLDAPLRVLPGNHDIGVEAFRASHPASSFPRTDGERGVRIARLDTTARGEGAVPPKPDIALSHYPLPATAAANAERCAALDSAAGTMAPTANGEAAARALARDPPALVFSAHLHVPLVTRAAEWVEVSVPPLCTYPQGYLAVTIGPEGTTVAFVPVASEADLARSCRARASASAIDATLAAASAWTLVGTPCDVHSTQ